MEYNPAFSEFLEKTKTHTLPSRTQFGTRILVPSSSGTGLPSPLPTHIAIPQRGLLELRCVRGFRNETSPLVRENVG